MSKAPSPLLGYNNNVRHKNKVFHIQTEDSGVKYGHIITHLFMDGGRILKSVKTSYSEYLGNEKMAEIVKEMMKSQHKAMFIALRDGKFDHLVEGRADASIQTKALVVEQAVAKLAEARESQRPKAIAATTAPVPVAPPVPVPEIAAAAPPPPPPPPLPALTPTPEPTRTMTPTSVNLVPAIAKGLRAEHADEPPPNTERSLPEELTLDIDALERAAAVAENASPSFRPASDLPPPPSNLFREKTATGQYRSLSQPPPPSPSKPAPERSVTPSPARGAQAAANERRYAPTRPASIFGQARPQSGKSIFGEDLISDKSLDEVILSYLADDLDPGVEKK